MITVLFSTPKRYGQNVCNNMRFLSVNTEGQSPTCPTPKKSERKIHKGSKTPKLPIDRETHGFHSILTVSRRERYFSRFYFKSHYYRLNSHCFQLWQLVYSEVSSKKTTMCQQCTLSHNIKVFILKMSVTYIMSSACSSDQLPYALPVADQIQLQSRSMRFVLNTHAHKNMT